MALQTVTVKKKLQCTLETENKVKGDILAEMFFSDMDKLKQGSCILSCKTIESLTGKIVFPIYFFNYVSYQCLVNPFLWLILDTGTNH